MAIDVKHDGAVRRRDLGERLVEFNDLLLVFIAHCRGNARRAGNIGNVGNDNDRARCRS